MLSDLAMPVGFTGWTTSQPLAKAVAIGEQPVDWAPKTRHADAGTRPAAISSLNDLCTLVRPDVDVHEAGRLELVGLGEL